MADVQIENGYTRVANELLEAVYKTDFTATELKILLFVMRFTFGFSKKSHQFSLTFISKGIGISKRYASNSVGKLINDNILKVIKEHTDTESRIVQLNKNYDKWMNRTAVQLVKQSMTGEAEYDTTDELEFKPTVEPHFHQDKQTLKKPLKKDIPVKHKYGEYQHVLLKDEELEKLKSEYETTLTEHCITYLDEYIEMKGYKAQSHYLCIRKWVVDAVKRKGDLDGNTRSSNNGYGHVKSGAELMGEVRAEAEARGETYEPPNVDNIFK